MPTFEARMRIIYEETWIVEAKDADDARKKFGELSDEVTDDDTGGEVVDWEVQRLKAVAVNGSPVRPHP